MGAPTLSSAKEALLELARDYFNGAPELRDRIEAGQQFNAYERADDNGYNVCLGPITDFMFLARCNWPDDADLMVDALRLRFGQKPALCALRAQAGEDQ